MTTSPVEKLVVRLGIPGVVVMMISGIYNLTDTYFVGSLGTGAVAAVGIVFPWMAIIQALGFFFGQGSGNYISRELGAQHINRASRMAATGFITCLIAATVLAVTGLLFIEPLSRILGATPTTLPYVLDYMLFVLIGAPFMAASHVLNNQLRFQGSSFYAMFGMIAGASLNIILDILFIFGFHMGVLGASLATALSQATGCAILLVCCTKRGNIRINPRHFSPCVRNYFEIARGGMPSLLRQGLQSAVAVLINRMAGAYGDAAIAAISIVNRLGTIAGSAVIGLGQGFQPVCGFNYGAKFYSRVKRAFWFCARFAVTVMAILALGMGVFAPRIIALFRGDDPELIAMGALYLRFQCAAMPFLGWVMICNMMTQTMGRAGLASLLAFVRQGLFPLLFLLILPRLFGLLGIQISQPASDMASFFFTIPFMIRILRKELKDHSGN